MTKAELIAALENAAGPDRALDVELFYAELERSHPRTFACIPTLSDQAPLYTGSLDAAISLVRARGLYWLASEGKTRPDEPLGAVQIRRPVSLEVLSMVEHARVEIATCIAVLQID
jgi:hypothetical protein